MFSGWSYSTELPPDRARYAEADDMLAAMHLEKPLKPGEQTERDRLGAYIAVLATAAGQGRNAYALSASEVADLQALVQDHYDRPAVWASNVLCGIYGICRAPFTGDVPAAKSNGARARGHEPAPTTYAAYGVQPNPARTFSTLTYDDGQTEGGLIEVRDLSGRLLEALMMNGPQGQQVLDTRSMAPGTYLLLFQRDGRTMGTTR